MAGRRPVRERFEIPLTVFPFLVGVGVGLPLWGSKAQPIFYATAAEVIALGAVAMALQGRFFEVGEAGPGSRYAALNRAMILIGAGTGLVFAFVALGGGRATPDAYLAMTAGGLSMGVSAFTVQAIFGLPGGE